MTTGILAEAATQAEDFMISGKWLIGAAVAIIPVLGTVWSKAKQAGKTEAQTTRLEPPIPEVPTRKIFTPPTWSDHKALCDRVKRVEDDVSDLRESQQKQFSHLLEAGAEREIRIMDKLDGIARGIHDRIDRILKPSPRA